MSNSNSFWSRRCGTKSFWHSLARRVLEELNIPKICVMCTSIKSIEVHHKNGDIRDNRPTNLEYLCLKCHHFKVHEIHLRLRKRIKVLCEVCQRKIERKPSELKDNKHHFCSNNCKYMYGRKQFKCQCCGKQVVITRFRYELSNNHFCSHKCCLAWSKSHSTRNSKGQFIKQGG